MQCRAYRRSPYERYGGPCTSESVGPILQVSGCYPQLKGEGGEVVTPGVLEFEFESVLSGHLNHRLTQDVGINLRDKEGIMDR
jgi:hypothetical protein